MSGQPVLMMGRQTCHGSEEVEDYCLDNACFIQFLHPHSSDQVQPCDLGLLGPTNANVSRICPAGNLSKQNKQVLEIFVVLETTLLPLTITHAFARAGIVLHSCVQHERLLCAVNPAAAYSVCYTVSINALS
jgi:hypothetical protein